MVKDFDQQEDVDRKAYIINAKKPALQAFSTKASAIIGELYAVEDRSKNKEAKKKEEDGYTVTNTNDLYTMPVKKDKMTNDKMGASGGAEKSEDYDDVAELKSEPMADSEPGQQSEGEVESLQMQTCSTQLWIRVVRQISDSLSIGMCVTVSCMHVSRTSM